jgi:hypothetical protein
VVSAYCFPFYSELVSLLILPFFLLLVIDLVFSVLQANFDFP